MLCLQYHHLAIWIQIIKHHSPHLQYSWLKTSGSGIWFKLAKSSHDTAFSVLAMEAIQNWTQLEGRAGCRWKSCYEGNANKEKENKNISFLSWRRNYNSSLWVCLPSFPNEKSWKSCDNLESFCSGASRFTIQTWL